MIEAFAILTAASWIASAIVLFLAIYIVGEMSPQTSHLNRTFIVFAGAVSMYSFSKGFGLFEGGAFDLKASSQLVGLSFIGAVLAGIVWKQEHAPK